jgi:putative ABC transport system ATP-binding protein
MPRRLLANGLPRGARPDPDAPAVEARALRKEYRTGAVVVEALRGIDVRIARGELVAVVGPSGCGKTSLLNCLAGLETEYTGEVMLAGVPLRALSDGERARLRARTTGFIFQQFNLLPTLSAIENVELPLLITGRPGGEAHSRAQQMLVAVGLGDRLDHRPAALSGGQQQRVACARALIGRPDVIFADEPTGNLDSKSGAEVLSFLRSSVREHGQTIVMVTHDPVAASYTDRVVFLADGAIVQELANPTPETVLEAMSTREVLV